MLLRWVCLVGLLFGFGSGFWLLKWSPTKCFERGVVRSRSYFGRRERKMISMKNAAKALFGSRR
jgi:hypothetical protein